jgi:hypothetical protein
LISLTNGGHFFRADSNEGGTEGYVPFSETRGAWRCVSDDGEKLHIVATGIDFSQKTPKFPDQSLARIDYDAVYNEESDGLAGQFTFTWCRLMENAWTGQNREKCEASRSTASV